VTDWTVTEVYAEASREDWARRTVADAGKSWLTHQAKFSGAVLPRQSERRRRRRVLPIGTVTVAAAEEMVEHAAWLLDRAARVSPVVVRPEDQDEVYRAQVHRS
jgi:hypothetical protein